MSAGIFDPVSSFRLRARLDVSIPSAFSGQRGYEPRFLGYGAPHLSARGTSTLLNNALLSAHFRVADDPGVIAPSTRQEKSGHPGGVYWIRVRHPLLHLLFYKVVENNVAGNCVDGLDLPPLTEDHKIQVRIRGRDESTRAVRIYGVGARNIHFRD